MTNSRLAQAYLQKVQVRMEVLGLLLERKAYSDVIREAQEVVELATKAMLRLRGLEPPKYHDVGPFLLEHRKDFPTDVADQMDKVAAICKWLRKEREFSFYGDVDFIPTEGYDLADACKAIEDARFVVCICTRLLQQEGRT